MITPPLKSFMRINIRTVFTLTIVIFLFAFQQANAGNNNSGVFTITGEVTVTINNLTRTGGNAPGNGGGILVNNQLYHSSIINCL